MATEETDVVVHPIQGDALWDLTREARTALSAIIGYSEMIIEDLGDGEPSAKDDLQKIRGASSKVLSLVARLEAHVDAAKTEAITDPLTGVGNRRAFERHCTNLLLDQDQELSLVLVDVDHFKAINDSFGHLVGDQVLKGVVKRCRSAIRDSDTLCRFAGDEFVILLPATAHAEASRVAGRIRDLIVDEPIRTSKGAIPVSVSVGVSMRAMDDQAPHDLLERADQAMYKAKESGRNQVATLHAP